MRFVGLAAAFAVAHWLLLVISSITVLALGMRRLDHPEIPVTTLERACRIVMFILEQPYDAFVHAMHLGGWVTIAPGILSSLLWGATLAWLTLLMRRRRRHMNGT